MRRALLLICLLAACARGGSASTDAPARDLVHRYRAALAADDPRAAYALLADGVRKNLPYEEFARRWRERELERKRQSIALSALLDEGAQSGERGRLTTSDGRSTELVRETSGWRLEAPLLSSARAATPEEVLRQLSGAVEERSIDGILATLTNARRERMSELLGTFAAGLRAHAGDTVDVSGDRATLTWSDGTRRFRVVMRREEGTWRVDDFSAL
ncbi:MAG TPA: hypothetical protein VKE22_02845 [Haliangiales bacterium]|nr:hypothetical protein [Haliangiales bacterium]